MQRTKREKNFPEPIAERIKSTKSAAQRQKKSRRRYKRGARRLNTSIASFFCSQVRFARFVGEVKKKVNQGPPKNVA